MTLKQIIIDMVDYILIVMFIIGQVGLILYMVNDLFGIIELDYKIRGAIGISFGLMFVNFFFLIFTKITLLLERKT